MNSDHMTDAIQVLAFKKWWKSYGYIILIALVICVVAGFSWRYWRDHKVTQAQNASVLYSQMMAAASQEINKSSIPIKGKQLISPHLSKAHILAQHIMTDYANTPYAGLSALWLAKIAVIQHQFSHALSYYKWIFNHHAVATIQQIAHLRSARILSAQKKYQQALTQLALVSSAGLQARVDEIKGDVYMAMNQPAKARAWHQKARTSYLHAGIQSQLISLKLATY